MFFKGWFFFSYANSMTRHSNDVKSAVALDLLFLFIIFFVYIMYFLRSLGRWYMSYYFYGGKLRPNNDGRLSSRRIYEYCSRMPQHTIYIISWVKRAKSRVLGNPRARII